MSCCGSKKAAKGVFEPGQDVMQRGITYETIKEECLAKEKLFVDSSFPPCLTSLYLKGSVPNKSKIKFLRPKDIVKKGQRPVFVEKGINYKDLDQGDIGNCWFVVSVSSVVAHQKKLVQKIIPSGQSFDEDYIGAFHFNFWHYGKWTEVIVDDYLPTVNGHLIYGKNREQPNEFWSPLLEKAYAKLQGCYQALNGGKIQSALTDLTGGISEYYDLGEKMKIAPNLYDLLLNVRTMNTLIGAAIHRKNEMLPLKETKRENGLYEGHAYTITKVAQVELNKKVHNLLRLRNPWGKGEWNGPWSDTSFEMRNLPADKKLELEVVNAEDGEFWIPFDEFVSNFDEIAFCHIQPDAVVGEIEDNKDRENWFVTTYHDAWIKDQTAGGCGNSGYEDQYWKNPQILAVLSQKDKDSDKCTMIVSLMEEEKHGKGNKIAINFDVYKLHYPVNAKLTRNNIRKQATKQQRSEDVYRFDREVTYHYQLPIGYYVIIPSTYNPGEEAKFLLRIFTKQKISSSTDMINEGTVEEPEFEAIYNAHANSENIMAAREIKQFLTHIFFREYKQRISFNLETSRNLLMLFDKTKSGHVTMPQMKEGWEKVKEYAKVFMETDTDNSGFLEIDELSQLLKKLGYEDAESLLKILKLKFGGLQNVFTFIDFIQIICKLTLILETFKEHKTSSLGTKEVAEFSLEELIESCLIY
ncbi:calpain-9-like, isoform X2 [Octopus vulgaris]|uniref:Calpain-9-like, isoform X2 n=1 Tax=Octopus vulgaris TaxID=6645 RepID=A0AA36B1B6_OCTVU|nr:calpain-9-like, isoform X2 [Octopus vulgaris]